MVCSISSSLKRVLSPCDYIRQHQSVPPSVNALPDSVHTSHANELTVSAVKLKYHPALWGVDGYLTFVHTALSPRRTAEQGKHALKMIKKHISKCGE